jgi:hemolysin D
VIRPEDLQNKKFLTASFGFLAILAFGFIGIGLWLWFGSLQESVSGTGQLVPEGKLRQIMSPINGAIAKVYVQENQEVKAGDLLIELDPEPTEAEHNSYTNQLDYLQNEASVLKAAAMGGKPRAGSSQSQDAWLIAAQNSYQAQINATKMQIEKSQHLLLEAEEKAKKQKELLAISEKMLIKHQNLFQVGGLTEKDMSTYEQQVIDQRGELASAKEEALARKSEIQQAEHQLRQIDSDYKKDILMRLTDQERSIVGLEGEINKNQVTKKRLQIFAPMDGTINEQAFHGPGEVTTTGQVLMSLVPKGSKLVAEVKVTNKDLSYIHQEQRVSIMIDAFPYQKFGRLHGKVIAISPSTVLTPNEKDSTPRYIVRIKPEKNFMKDGQTVISLRSGMTLTADIITREKNILSFFTEPLNYSFDRAFRDPSSRAEKL